MYQLAYQFSYFGVAVASFVGALSIVFPIPYTVLIFLLGASGRWNPILLAVAGGVGSALGEGFGYVLGYFGRVAVSPERRRKIDYVLKVLNRYGPIVVFIFALTPLPDDLLFIPLGIMRYKFTRLFIPCFLGKFLMCYLLASFGRAGASFILNLFGEGGEWITVALTAILLVAILTVLLKVDWEKVLAKYVKVDA